MDGIEIHAALQALGNPRILIDRIVAEALTLIPSAEGSVVELAESDLLRYEWASGTLAAQPGSSSRWQGACRVFRFASERRFAVTTPSSIPGSIAKHAVE